MLDGLMGMGSTFSEFCVSHECSLKSTCCIKGTKQLGGKRLLKRLITSLQCLWQDELTALVNVVWRQSLPAGRLSCCKPRREQREAST